MKKILKKRFDEKIEYNWIIFKTENNCFKVFGFFYLKDAVKYRNILERKNYNIYKIVGSCQEMHNIIREKDRKCVIDYYIYEKNFFSIKDIMDRLK